MECTGIPELRYSEWSESLHKKVRDKRTPLAGSLELTFRCNNNCVHCYCNTPPNDAFEMAKEMDSWMIKDIISQLADEGCLWLFLTGGEPLLRPDFREIYLHTKKRGILITLFTNGTLIDERLADFHAEWRPFSTEITLYGATEKTYEEITKVKGSYKRCIRGIELLLERKVPLKLKTMALRHNIHEIPLMKGYAESLGLEFRFDPMVNSRLDTNKGPLFTRLKPEEIVRLDIEDEKRAEEWKKSFNEHAGPPGSDKLYTCGAGLDSFHIDPYGNLSICIISRKEQYNLKIGTFREGWYNFIERMREITLRTNIKCRECNIANLCGQCPGWSQVELGDDETPVEFLCEVAHKRAEAFGVEIS
ncbi:MAG: radical SAM protein [Nitrospirae bacterium]|nr:radical SAM protein [Nitrospirota bacterium]MCL5421444.1 radical SAM protein [Nitrospirota bacterium]